MDHPERHRHRLHRLDPVTPLRESGLRLRDELYRSNRVLLRNALAHHVVLEALGILPHALAAKSRDLQESCGGYEKLAKLLAAVSRIRGVRTPVDGYPARNGSILGPAPRNPSHNYSHKSSTR